MDHDLNDILNDRSSGSAHILKRCIQYFVWLLQNGETKVEVLLESLKRIRKNFPGFAILMHFIDYFENRLYDGLSGEKLAKSLLEYLETWNNSHQKIAASLTGMMQLNKSKVLLHSNSATIHDLFRFLVAHHYQVEVFQTLSAPNNEGLKQAKEVSGAGFRVTLMTEASIGLIFNELDMIVLGADIIHKQGFINKTGSLAIALMAQYFKKPLYVVADSRKIWQQQYGTMPSFNNLQDPYEIASIENEGIHILNYYFEEVPGKLVTGYVFEQSGITI